MNTSVMKRKHPRVSLNPLLAKNCSVDIHCELNIPGEMGKITKLYGFRIMDADKKCGKCFIGLDKKKAKSLFNNFKNIIDLAGVTFLKHDITGYIPLPRE